MRRACDQFPGRSCQLRASLSCCTSAENSSAPMSALHAADEATMTKLDAMGVE